MSSNPSQPAAEHDPDARCPDCDHFYEHTNFSDDFYPQWKDICNEQDASGNGYCHCKNAFHEKRDRLQPAADKATPLKPCPFCGNRATVESGDGFHVVRCNGRRCFVNSSTGAYSRDDAIAQWNTRAQSAAVEGLETTMRDILAEAECVADAKAPFSTWVAEKCRAALAAVEEKGKV